MKKPREDYGYLLWMDGVRASCPEFSRIVFLQGDERRWVKAGSIYGLASAYSKSLVYVEWKSPTFSYMNEWFPAAGVHSVLDEDWHGLPLCD